MHNEKIRILHIIKSLGRGGAEMLLPETLRLHDKGSFEFHYAYFLPWKDQMVESIQLNGGKVTCFNSNNNLQLMLKITHVARYVRENKIQLIHAHLPWSGILARIVGKLCSVPVIYTEHNKQERYHFVTRLMNLITLDLLAMVIAVSNDVAESIHKYKPRLKAPVRAIANGVNTDHFRKQAFIGNDIREKFKIPNDVPIIGTIAVFRFQKRLDLWMELADRILKQFENAHFVIVGDGPLKEALMKKRDELGLKTRIHMPGLEIEVRPYLASFNVYMMSSLFEGLPIALLEAMAMECAVISTNAGGIKEVIRHEVDGLICPVPETDKLVEYACSLLEDNNLQMKYGGQARKRVIETFSMEKMVSDLEGVYKEIIEGQY